MTPNEYQKAALRTEHSPEFINGPSYLSRLMHGAIGMCTEAGELQDMLKKHLIYGKPLDLTNAVEEATDCLWYIAIVLDAAGVSMEDAMIRNITKLQLRYPDKFTSENALNRDLDAERQALEGSSDLADSNPMRRESRAQAPREFKDG